MMINRNFLIQEQEPQLLTRSYILTSKNEENGTYCLLFTYINNHTINSKIKGTAERLQTEEAEFQKPGQNTTP